MKKILLRVAGLAGVAGAALALSSCMYDSGQYAASSSYGYGSGYGGSSFSTSYFVTTGDPLWGYDPHVRSYYHYPSRRYYDPYLSGYYPVGYRPHYVVGVPHPHGWNSNRRWAPPPRRVRDHRLRNYENRADAYRRTDYSWAKDVRRQDAPRREPNRPSGHVRPGSSSPDYSSGRNPSHTGRNPAIRPDRNPHEQNRPGVRPQTPPRYPSRDVTPPRGSSSRPDFRQQDGRRPTVRPQANSRRPQLEVRNQPPQSSGRQPQMAQRPSYSQSRVPVTTDSPSRGARSTNSRGEDSRGEGSRNPSRSSRGR